MLRPCGLWWYIIRFEARRITRPMFRCRPTPSPTHLWLEKSRHLKGLILLESCKKLTCQSIFLWKANWQLLRWEIFVIAKKLPVLHRPSVGPFGPKARHAHEYFLFSFSISPNVLRIAKMSSSVFSTTTPLSLDFRCPKKNRITSHQIRAGGWILTNYSPIKFEWPSPHSPQCRATYPSVKTIVGRTFSCSIMLDKVTHEKMADAFGFYAKLHYLVIRPRVWSILAKYSLPRDFWMGFQLGQSAPISLGSR
jgi:hypothetical protein